MTTNQSVQFFIRLVKEKDSALRAAADQLLQDLVSDDSTRKKTSAEKTLQLASDLRAVLSQSDIPAWLNDTINYLENFTKGFWHAQSFIAHFIRIKWKLDNHHWQFDQVTDVAFDFDSIFEHYKKDSRLPELFDEIILILEEIEASGEVDSLSMINALAKVIATIRKSKDGSYFSLNSAWEFLLSFLNNYMWGELSKLPVLGTALEALSKTIQEANEEMFKVHKAVQDEMVRSVAAEVKALSNKSAFSFMEYNRNGHLLPTSNIRQLPNFTA